MRAGGQHHTQSLDVPLHFGARVWQLLQQCMQSDFAANFHNRVDNAIEAKVEKIRGQNLTCSIFFQGDPFYLETFSMHKHANCKMAFGDVLDKGSIRMN